MLQSLLLALFLSTFQLHADREKQTSMIEDLQTIAQLAPDGKQHNIETMCTALQNKEQISLTIIENAFEEAIACLNQCKDTLPQEEVARLANSLETAYANLLATEPNSVVHGQAQDEAADSLATKGTQKFINVLVRNHLSAGFLTVGGSETIGGNLLVKGNETINGNLTVHGTTIFSGTAILVSGDQTINGNLTVLGHITTNGIQSTGNNTFTGPTSINTTGTAATNIGNCTSATDIEGVITINTSCTTPTTIGTAGGATNIGSSASLNTLQGTTRHIGPTLFKNKSHCVPTFCLVI